MPTCDEDFLTCALCMEVYSDPRTLPCLHSFCYTCLNDLLRNIESSQFQRQENTLKCPLCQEKHVVPKNGASDFRKDFRIASLLDKMKSTNAASVQEQQAIVANSACSDNCERHPDQSLHYYCEEERCDKAICELCWANDHERHSVILLHKALEDLKTRINTEADKYKNMLARQIQEIIDAKESLTKNVAECNTKVAKVVRDYHTMMDTFQNNMLLLIKDHENENEIKLDAELNRLLNIQEKLNSSVKFKVMPNFRSIADETLSNMTKLGNNIARWSFQYSKPVVKRTAELPKDLLTITYAEQSLGSETRSGLSNVQDSQEELNDTQNAPLKGTRNKPSTDISTSTLEEAQGVPANAFDDIVSKYKLLNYRRNKVRFMAHSPSRGLILAQDGFLTCLDNLTHSIETFCVDDDWDNPIPMDVLQYNGTDYLVELDPHHDKLLFSSEHGMRHLFEHWDYTQPCRKVSGKHLSCVGGYTLYTHIKNGQTSVTCLAATYRMPPRVLWTCDVPLTRVSSICAVCCASYNYNSPFVVCASSFPRPLTCGCETALVALDGKDGEFSSPLWELSCNQLDIFADIFDLVDMAFDGRQIFVLNKQGPKSCLYVVSLDGSKVRKVSTEDGPLLIKGGCKMTVDRQQNLLFIATQDHFIHVFKINQVL